MMTLHKYEVAITQGNAMIRYMFDDMDIALKHYEYKCRHCPQGEKVRLLTWLSPCSINIIKVYVA